MLDMDDRNAATIAVAAPLLPSARLDGRLDADRVKRTAGDCFALAEAFVDEAERRYGKLGN